MCRSRQRGHFAFNLAFAVIVLLDLRVAFEVDFLDLGD
jgi:hypothetical protein